MRNLSLGLIGFATICLAGCAASKEMTYVSQAQTIKPISVPSGLSAAKIRPYYPIPPLRARAPGNVQPSLVPPGSNLAVLAKSKSNGGDK